MTRHLVSMVGRVCHSTTVTATVVNVLCATKEKTARKSGQVHISLLFSAVNRSIVQRDVFRSIW